MLSSEFHGKIIFGLSVPSITGSGRTSRDCVAMATDIVIAL